MTAVPAGRIAPAPHNAALHPTIRLFILIFPLITILLTGASRAVAATTITVTAADDIVADNGQCSLREAITNANADNQSGSIDCPAGSGADTIVINLQIVTLTGQLNTTSDITITGPGGTNVVIQAGPCDPTTLPGGCSPATHRVLEVVSGSLTLTGLTIRHGGCSTPCDGGGALVDPGAALTLDAAAVTANKSAAGGGISNSGTLIVRDGSLIYSNVAAAGGGGLANVGGTATLSQASVTGNQADTGAGIANYSTLTIDSSVVAGNAATGAGGGINVQHGTIKITNTRLEANTSGGLGSGVAVDDFDAFKLTDSCITGNSGTAIQNNLGSPALNTTANWWGSPAGPTTPTVTTTYGDKVGANVDVSNFKTLLPGGCTSISPYAALTPALTFPDELINTTSAPLAVLLTSAGTNTLKISKVLVTGPYALASNTCDGQTLTFGDPCTFSVTFTPVGVGRQTGAVVIVDNADGGPQVYTLSGTGLTPAPPPALKLPKNGMPVYKPPKLGWKAVKGAPAYHVEVDNNSDFSSPELSGDAKKPAFATKPLAFGIYYWHVAYKETVGQGRYSAPFKFEMTLNKTPAKNAALKNGQVKFAWQAVAGKSYLLEYSSDPAFPAGPLTTRVPMGKKATYTIPKNLALAGGNKTYYWHVSIDGGLTWTPYWTFTVK